VFALIILSPILIVAVPGAVKAQSSPTVTGSPAKLSPKQRLVYVMAAFPVFESLIEDTGLLDAMSDVPPASSRLGEGVAPEAPTATQIEYWRDVTVNCFVRASSFASLKVDWEGTPGVGESYLGDCIFAIEYGAEYGEGGTTAMPGDKVITDTWKRGLEEGFDEPYLIQMHSTEFDDHGNCDGVYFDYDPTTGAVEIRIGATPGAHWRCGSRLAVIARSGLDSSVFSPKPRVSSTVLDADTGEKVKPEDMATDAWYTLQLEMKSFAIKTPALPKQSGFRYAQIGLIASRYHAVPDTGMYLENIDPYWYSIVSGMPPGQTNAEAYWTFWNNVYAETGGAPLFVTPPPSTPKVIFSPSLMTTTEFQKSNAVVGPNNYDPGTNTGKLYSAYIYLVYLHKGISFITGNDIQFSGNPPDIAPIRYNLDVQWSLLLQAGYPDYTCPGSCA